MAAPAKKRNAWSFVFPFVLGMLTLGFAEYAAVRYGSWILEIRKKPEPGSPDVFFHEQGDVVVCTTGNFQEVRGTFYGRYQELCTG